MRPVPLASIESDASEGGRIFNSIRIYGFAATWVVVGVMVRLSLDPLIGFQFPYATLYFAVLLSAWYGGVGPAFAALALGVLAEIHFLLPPPRRLVDHEIGPGDRPRTVHRRGHGDRPDRRRHDVRATIGRAQPARRKSHQQSRRAIEGVCRSGAGRGCHVRSRDALCRGEPAVAGRLRSDRQADRKSLPL
jgi:hypothetical protein